jgi:hypothetical protein
MAGGFFFFKSALPEACRPARNRWLPSLSRLPKPTSIRTISKAVTDRAFGSAAKVPILSSPAAVLAATIVLLPAVARCRPNKPLI